MNFDEKDFDIIRRIFEETLRKEGIIDFIEICGDETEDFCKKLLNKLDEFYANL